MPLRSVQIEGLRELSRDLRKFDADVAKRLAKLNKSFAGRVASLAQDKFDDRYTSRSGKTRRGIRALATASRAQVAIGGARVPQLLGMEFGSYRFPQFPAWRGNKGDAGYFLYPSIREETPRLEAEYLDAVDDLLGLKKGPL